MAEGPFIRPRGGVRTNLVAVLGKWQRAETEAAKLGKEAGRGRMGESAEGREGLGAKPSINSGAEGDRTPDLMTASHALSQLSYGPSDAATLAPQAARAREHVQGALRWLR